MVLENIGWMLVSRGPGRLAVSRYVVDVKISESSLT